MDKTIIFKPNQLLLDIEREVELLKDGYTIFPFLNTETVEKLTNYYTTFQNEEPSHFYSSTHSINTDFRKQVNEFIKSIISPFVSIYFDNYRLLGGAFVVKPANGKGLLPPHQDWNLVDETKARSYNIWIPLTDVTFDNGAVCVLKGSHLSLPTYRGPGIPSVFKNIEPLVWENLEVLPMKSGQALLYDHALLHASPVNKTDKIRLGIVCGIIKKDSEMQLYFNKENCIEAYQIDEIFFMDKNPQNGPEGLIFKKTLPQSTPISSDVFTRQYLNKKNSGLKAYLGAFERFIKNSFKVN
jgi:hypothetical protein